MALHPYSNSLQRARLLAQKGQLRAAQEILQENFPENPSLLPHETLEEAHALEEEILLKHIAYQALQNAEEECAQILAQEPP
jgi:hypothetical protein